MRYVIAFALVLLLSFDGWGCSDPDYGGLRTLTCRENGGLCTHKADCCDPNARCLTCTGAPMGVCTVPDGGAQ